LAATRSSSPVDAGDEPVAQEQAVLEFLNGDFVLRWAEAVLGL
jgi:hypothetical protein